MNKKQKFQLLLAALSVILFIFWLITPGWETGKILGLLSNVLCALAMLVSYWEEEQKKSQNKD